MNRGRASSGYTIVELLIFLAVSSAMFVSTMALLGGRQARTEFQQSMGNLSTELQDIANDVSTGYYAPNLTTGGAFSCASNGSSSEINLTPESSDRQGTNSGCIFIGNSIKFMPNNERGRFVTMTLIGKRQFTSGANTSNSENLQQSGIKAAVANDGVNNGDDRDASRTSVINGGGEVACIFYLTVAQSVNTVPCTTTNRIPTDTLTFLNTFVPNGATDGTRSVDLVVPGGTGVPNTTRSVTDAAAMVSGFSTSNPPKNPAGGTYICVNSTGSNQHGLIKLSGSGSALLSDYFIAQGKCS